MEDNPQTPSTNTPPAARTAQALRELHDRARNALAAQRERMGQLEAQLTHQLDTIADTLSGQIAAQGAPGTNSEQSMAEVERLRTELERTRVEWNTERESWQNERTQLLAADNDRLQTMEQRQRELESRQVTLDERAADLNHQDRELRQRQELVESLERECAEQRSHFSATESALEKQRSDIAAREAELELAKAELDRAKSELEQAREAHHAADATYQEQQLALAAERDSIAAQRAALDSEREQSKSEQDAIVADRAALAAERMGLTEERAAFQLERVAFDAEREAFNEQVNAHSSTHLEGNEAAAAYAALEKQLELERSTWERERASVDEQRRLLAKERDNLTTALEAARHELQTARESAGAIAERDDLQHKFNLALEDAQRLRTTISELEQELSRRPSASEADSLEIVHLRAERDALAERVSELEKSASGGTSSQDQSELQRRFELAVEDVRDLKKRNAELESQLAAAKATGGPANPSVGGSNWEAMKRKMLANLEGEGDDVDDSRAEERETIENTIRITDDALARKDREIDELKSQLSQSAASTVDAEAAIRELVDADEVIAEHRARIAKLEQEMQEKLRAAELELSVERAKIARETAQLADLKAELESQRANHEVDSAMPAGQGGAQHPKRRWLSKLGLSGEEQG